MLTILQSLPGFLRKELFNLLEAEINQITPEGIDAEFAKDKEYVLARVAALFHL